MRISLKLIKGANIKPTGNNNNEILKLSETGNKIKMLDITTFIKNCAGNSKK